MVKKSPTPWLADFVSAEIRQVIDWKRTLSDNIKPDPDSRFDDDGSNFRSVATDLPTHCSLQLIEVILAKQQPTVVVSDGHTRIKARLSQDAVAVLEDEAGAKFTKDMLNDVFQPALLTVISTPLGTPDGFIQLYIDGIEYEHHLRRSEGQPSPIEENENIQILLDDIRKIRCAGLPSSDPHDFEPAGLDKPAFDSPRSTISQQLHKPTRLPTKAASARDSAPKSSPASRINDNQISNWAIQTQRVMSRKKAGPNLDRDGFEVESGLNLDRPLQVASNNAPDTNAGRSALAPNAQSDHVLGLLGGRTGGKRSREESPPLHRSPVVVAESPSNVIQGDDGASRTITALGKDTPNLSSTAPPSAQPPPKQTQASLRSSGNASVPYGRRKIPVNQWNLLDRKDSWLPSMPGQSFPSPNVPIELLTKWNALMKNAPESLRMSQATDTAEAVPDDEVDSSGEESEDDSDSVKEFGPSQWGSSPPARAVELPPDSSFESVVRGSQQDELRVAPPRAMPTARTVASAATLRNPPPPKPAGSASREEYGSWERSARPHDPTPPPRGPRSSQENLHSWERSARRDGPIHPPRGPRSSREDHGSWERSAMRDDAGHPSRGPRSYLAEFSSPARSQPTRPSQTRSQDQSSRFERRSPRRLHGDDAATIYDGSGSRPPWSLREKRPSSAHSPQRRPSSQVMPDRTIDQSPRRSIAGRSPSGVWTTTQTGEESPRRPAVNGNAMSPPTGPRAMQTPSRTSIPQSQLSVDRSARASPFPNVPMVGRRKSGAPPHSSPREPRADNPNGHVSRNDNLNKPEESRPPTSSHRSVTPGTQMAEPPSRPAKDAYDDRPVGTHEPPREQHPDERYREVRRERTWHYKRRDW
ncbi:hypothetical protein M409DRAFT_49918 [Zasmidium cellare ATCC 36951]|uniref:Shelterin complex subunit TPP1/Est3 domain-containing protein n=1 Tax=Zasmidium cellare ATCC 36951 TaxID=1080233 RepID=A0A6A6CYC2_ZASCE|nr:uncharacterized protein M409DRAFT_49918 [Zasmidium cellare ATCC 36951]KAF2172184.1 hypothetical protein M409DRAFT_49918 [Zasmidium cellare ATCC 36951]